MNSLDYDVAIIGGSPVGRYAALRAIQLGAKVAIVEPPLAPSSPQASPWSNMLSPHVLSHIGQLKQQLSHVNQLGINWAASGTTSFEAMEAQQWVEGVASTLEEQNSLTLLSSLGVDAIVGSGQFVRLPQLAFTVSDPSGKNKALRHLLARTYLLATGSCPTVPKIEGLKATGYVTPAEIWQPLTSPQPPQGWAILGGDPLAIQLAQTLTRLGCNVTLVVRSHLLSTEDLEISLLVQANLEAEGVRVLTKTPVIQVKQIEDKKWIQAGDEAIETDEILLCAGQQPNVTNLNLETVGVKWNRQRILLNQKLQTTNPRIYACGDAIGGYQFTNIANYEARIALKNALFFPIFKVDYSSIPWAIFGELQIARVGLSEVQARQEYNDIVVLRQYFKSIAAAQLRDEMTGLCKVVLQRNGKILGAAIVGSQAGELINVMALAIAQKLKVDAIVKLAPIYPSFSEIFDQIATAWNQQRFNYNTTLHDFLAGLFNFRRSWRL